MGVRVGSRVGVLVAVGITVGVVRVDMAVGMSVAIGAVVGVHPTARSRNNRVYVAALFMCTWSKVRPANGIRFSRSREAAVGWKRGLGGPVSIYVPQHQRQVDMIWREAQDDQPAPCIGNIGVEP